MISNESISKKALKKIERDKIKKNMKLIRQQAIHTEADNNIGIDISQGKYGIWNSSKGSQRIFMDTSSLNKDNIGQTVLIRSRVHSVRDKGNLVFLILRQQGNTIQAVSSKTTGSSKQMLKFISKINPESIVDIEAIVKGANIESCTVKDVELVIETFFVISHASSPLPILLEDAERSEIVLEEQRKALIEIGTRLSFTQEKLVLCNPSEKEVIMEEILKIEEEKRLARKYVDLTRKIRLDNRIIDLRTPTNQAIFRIQSAVCELFREFLINLNFTEIHTPKLISAASEGGADVFKLSYFGQDAFLAQSPQLYKQMCICADMNKVFEVAPIFRSENSNTHRHMNEFIGLDMELAFNEHYHEVLDILENLLFFIFEQINIRFSGELDIIQKQYPFSPLMFNRDKPLRLTHNEAIDILKTSKPDIEYLYDIGTADEKILGKLIKEKYQTDFYIIDKFPSSQRPFYTMPDPDNKNYSNSYDFFIRGEEILSGSQRIHDPDLLIKNATSKGIDVDKLKDYIDAFRFGAPPHGGGGIGLERVVMLFLGLPNIRLTSLYPRTPDRITP